ncbi:hypothetical protein IC607_02685 [Cellulomonas sp. JH27-2]|uniref:hypothetical protein n=1 Tax=Cellulomonas sp. JH27-2 TaxID=2774139 RepID=UPI00177D4BA3|nr:hypothetical protein [Cellulomonas sp. JH27-2]MBD8057869.1 hypothetical protein [Cellulomonas sp. JH27-2]
MGTLEEVVKATASDGVPWKTIAVAVLGSSAVAAFVTSVLDGMRSTSSTRRDGYAAVSTVLLRRVEFAFRIRRRAGDDPATLAALSALGSDIQEELARSKAWVAAESKYVQDVLLEVCRAIDAEVAPFCESAWGMPPVSQPTGMNLSGWGPTGHGAQLEKLNRAVARRFGWRRAVPHRWWGLARRHGWLD